VEKRRSHSGLIINEFIELVCHSLEQRMAMRRHDQCIFCGVCTTRQLPVRNPDPHTLDSFTGVQFTCFQLLGRSRISSRPETGRFMTTIVFQETAKREMNHVSQSQSSGCQPTSRTPQKGSELNADRMDHLPNQLTYPSLSPQGSARALFVQVQSERLARRLSQIQPDSCHYL
jgi:hypothetical protein